MSASENPKKRVAFTDKDRQSLRVHNKSYLGLKPHQLASWFECEFGRKVSTSSVYDILSEKYAYLDNAEATEAVRKKKGPQWAELEKALFEWWQNVQPRDVTGKDLKAKANELWYTLPGCRGKKSPTFSDGWLSNWRVRHGLGQSSKKAEIVPVESDLGAMDDGLMGDSISHPWQSTTCSQAMGTMVRTAIPPFVQPTESRLPFDHLKPQPSINQLDITSPFLHALPPIANSFRATGFPNGGKRKRGTSKSASKARHWAKRPKLMAYRHTDMMSFQHVAPNPIQNQSAVPFRKTLWKGVQELFSDCNTLNADGRIIAGDTIRGLFQPIVDSLNFSRPWRAQERVTTFNTEKAIHLFAMAENFQLRKVQSETQNIIMEEWFLDAIDLKLLRSESPESSLFDGESSSSYNLANLIPSRRAKGRACLTASASAAAKYGKINITTKSFVSVDAEKKGNTASHFQAKIAITPKATSDAVPQTELYLATRTTGHTTTLLTPVISFRNIIPENSKVFEIARYGTSVELQMILSNGDASLSDCDPAGRSLINYALQSSNCSTLKFLITRVEDVNAFEPPPRGTEPRPLLDLCTLNTKIRTKKQEAKLECLKLMLMADADPLLNTPVSASPFEQTLLGSAFETTKAILDLGLSYLNTDKIRTPRNESTPLQLLAFCHSLPLASGYCDFREKVFLFLERGADASVRDNLRETYLHMFLQFGRDMEELQLMGFKDILMCFVTAGADVYASDNARRSVSQTACTSGHESLWREVLAECGYDSDEVFSSENVFKPRGLRDIPRIGISSVRVPVVRSTRLTFAEYSRQRKSLQCVQNVDTWKFDYILNQRRINVG